MTRILRRQEEWKGEIATALDGRRIVWIGVRGSDATPLVNTPGLHHITAITSPLAEPGVPETTLEHLSQVRVDPDQHDLDLDTSSAAEQMRAVITGMLDKHAAILPYRPTHFLSEFIADKTPPTVYLGMSAGHQRLFENKPWVEQNLTEEGVRTLGWEQIPPTDAALRSKLEEYGPLVVRPSTGSGGVGMRIIDTPSDLPDLASTPGRQVSVSRYLAEAIPLNVGGCVFRDGVITTGPLSIQLIGIPNCTMLPLGYCGNDFGAARVIPLDVVDSVESTLRRCGRWLAGSGYIGAFGVDLIIHDDLPYLAEVNPRFQGSSVMAAAIAIEMGMPTLHHEHIAAHLGMTAPASIRLRDWVADQPAVAQINCHNTELQRITMGPRTSTVAEDVRCVPDEGIAVEPGGLLFRVVAEEPVTINGRSLTARHTDRVESVRTGLRGGPAPTH